MDPTRFGKSSIPLHHEPYGPLTSDNLRDMNKGKVAVVSGAARGIGRAIAKNLALSGADLAILDLRYENLSETESICQRIGVKVKSYACDVTDVERVRAVLNNIERELGHISILVNNAGVASGKPQWLESFEDFWRVIEVNLKSAMLMTWSVLPSMRQRGSGCIVNIASRAATVDVPFATAYNSSKTAITRAVSTLQEELELDGLGEKIHMYALHPGSVLTSMSRAEPLPEVCARYPQLTQHGADFASLFVDSPDLCGATCAYLASGKAKQLRGMYWDCRQDVERVCGIGRENLLREDLYKLKIEFAEGYKNEP